MKELKKLVLLHSNDMHGDFLSEGRNEKLIGGVSLLSGYINKVREEEPNTLYCIAGDMFRGSVIDQEFLGISTIEIMNMLAPDVVTLGNHETDYGLAHLLFLEKCAKFPIINANMYIRINHAHLFKPYRIIEIGGMKILFIGILTEEVLAQTKNDGMIGTLVNVEEAAEEVRRICDAHNAIDIDFTVLLTHIGFEEDKKLASLLDPACGVDVIIGGHSHTFITEPAKVNDILIVQAGTGTDQIGRFDIMVDTENNCVDSWEWKTVPITSDYCPKDEALEGLLNRYLSRTNEKYSRVVTRFNRKLTHPSRTQETDLGGLMADAMKESLGVDIFLLGSGSIRSEAMGPIVMLSDLAEAFPYDDADYLVTVTGKQLKDMIRYMVRDEVWQGVHCEFYQFSKGLHVVYSISEHAFKEFTFNDEEVADDRLFNVGLQRFHYKNFDDNFHVPMAEVEKNRKPRVIATSSRQVIDEYLSEHQHLDHRAGERLVILP
ncbi:MAG: bifunctional metallophosphatase/5'-nucleotidase [Lachnospiraceae bacterium]|nr:bifunctional metallophosphatase/5'-nucleotidase [Lachnospiraceae bacterium]